MNIESNMLKAIVKKVIIITLILICLFAIGVKASNSKINTVTIVFSDDCEISVITGKTLVSDILEENHIILMENENVYPSLDSNIDITKKIIITKGEPVKTVIAEETSNITEQQILGEYVTIVEKIIIEQEEIPFETVIKDNSNDGDDTTDRVLQEGENGIREVKYKVKYQNDVEIEKKEISSKIIKKPVNKIVEVRNKQVTSRGGTTTRYGGKWTYSESELDLLCAITAQEACSSYNAALAVITCAANRAESKKWRYNGTDPLSQYMAKGQFCYSIDNHWRRRLNGNYPSYVKQAVIDALNGKRNHNYLSFRSAGYASGVNIGGNVYFNAM